MSPLSASLTWKKPVFVDRPLNKVGGGGTSCGVTEGEKKPALSDNSGKIDKGQQSGKDGVKCFYCNKKGHIMAECPVLQ